MTPEPAGSWTLDSQGRTWAPTDSASPWEDWLVHIDGDGDLDPLTRRGPSARVTCDGETLEVTTGSGRERIMVDALFAYFAACPAVDVDDLIARLERAKRDHTECEAQVQR